MKLILPFLLLFFGSCNLLSDTQAAKSVEDTGTNVLEATCSDSLKNGNETDLNCGGDCRPCTDNWSCLVDSDCTSGLCEQKICSPPQCNDGVKNGTESDLDCGGNCDPCEIGSTCVALRDCLSQSCEDSICLDSCGDKCGGECSRKCEEGEACQTTADCAENLKCEDVCVVPPEGWQRTISFLAPAASNNFYAYVLIPELVEREIEKLNFEQNGTSIPSEPAEENGAYWVYLENVVMGENTFSLKMDESKIRDELPIWTDQIAVFHTPGLSPIIANEITVLEAINVQSTPGRFGSASFFDGSAYVLATGNEIDSLFPTFSISVWVNPDVISEGWKPIIGRQFSTTSSDDIALGDFRSGKFYACSSGGCASTTNAVPPNKWTFITMTFDTTMKLYLNGELDAERRGTRNESNAANPLTIGGDIDNIGGVVDTFFRGSIDEVRFSSKVQTAAAVRLQFLSADASFFSVGEKQPL